MRGVEKAMGGSCINDLCERIDGEDEKEWGQRVTLAKATTMHNALDGADVEVGNHVGESQEKGVMSTTTSFSLGKKPRFNRPVGEKRDF
jgi:hypothetical protein